MLSLQNECIDRLLKKYGAFYNFRYHNCNNHHECDCEIKKEEIAMLNEFRTISKEVWEIAILDMDNFQKRICLADMGQIPLSVCYEQFDKVCRLELCNLVCEFSGYMDITDFHVNNEDILDKIKELYNESPKRTYNDKDTQQFYEHICELGASVGNIRELTQNEIDNICEEFEAILGDYLYTPFFTCQTTNTFLIIVVDLVFDDIKFGYKGGQYQTSHLFYEHITCFSIFEYIESLKYGIIKDIHVLENESYDVHYLKIGYNS